VALNLNGVMISSEQPGALTAFYSKILGEPVWSGGDFTAYQAGSGFLTVGPHSDVKGANTSPGRIMMFLETAEVEAEFERMKGLGATVVQPPYHPGVDPSGTLATLADPDGNYFQLATPFPG
jgi:predicted enzyme related to lactoylglutathione lyase